MNPEDDLSRVWCDFGWWPQPNGQRRLLSWNAATLELKLWALSRFDEDTVLTVIDTEDEVRRRLGECDCSEGCRGWTDHNETVEGLAWLTRRLEGCR